MTTASQELTTSATPLTSLDSDRLWRSNAPSRVKKTWDASAPEASWLAWREHLAKRNPTASLDRLLSKSDKPLAPVAWGVAPERELMGWLTSLDTALSSSKAKTQGNAARIDAEAAQWAPAAREREITLEFALEAVAWAHALPRLAAVTEAATWWALCEGLYAITNEATGPAAPDGSSPEASAIEQLLAGELPLVLSRLLPEISPFEVLGAAASEALGEGLLRLTDGEGLLPAPVVAAPIMTDGADAPSVLLACWTRCHALGGKRKGPWSSDAEVQFEWLTRQTLRLVDRHGRFPFGARASNLPLINAAIELAGDEADDAAADLRLKGRNGSDDTADRPSPSNHSEWSELGVLAAGWRDKAPRIVAAHPGSRMAIEIHSGKLALLVGDWPVIATRNGKKLTTTGDWETQCWYSDQDADFLELAIPLEGPEGSMRLERQIMVSRNDGVAMLGEVLLAENGAPAADLSLTTELPFGAETKLRLEKETREGFLEQDGKATAGVVPLSLPEWRDDPRGGELTAQSQSLRLTRQENGRNLASALWIDFSASRFKKQRTWRQLAVGESLQRVENEVAVGYRVQAAKDQWLIYRSLDPPANRTLLGQNLSSECLVGRFLTTGEVDEYFEIEGDE